MKLNLKTKYFKITYMETNKYKDKVFVFVDTETTGTASTDRVIQIAWITARFDGEKFQDKDEYSFYVDPPFLYESDFHYKNGLDYHTVKSKAHEHFWVFSHLVKSLNDSDIVVCHNLDFDLPKIRAEINIANLKVRNGIVKLCTMKPPQIVNHVKAKFKNARAGRYKWPTLKELSKKLDVDFDEKKAHEALFDVTKTLECTEVLIKKKLL